MAYNAGASTSRRRFSHAQTQRPRARPAARDQFYPSLSPATPRARCWWPFGDTRVICTASVSKGVPRFLRGQGRGWLTAEYGMLPRSTGERMDREAARGKQGGRTVEIQRLIGRSLRAAVDLEQLGEYTINIDCDVIQADGGTRTAAIPAAVSRWWMPCVTCSGKADRGDPLRQMMASVSVGVVDGEPVLDLDYMEDSSADTDMNVIMADRRSSSRCRAPRRATPSGARTSTACWTWRPGVSRDHRSCRSRRWQQQYTALAQGWPRREGSRS